MLWGIYLHGAVFVALKRFLEDRYGADVVAEVFAKELSVSVYQVYPDELFGKLLERASTLTGYKTDRLLRELGANAIPVFHKFWPAAFPPEGAFRFLLRLEENIIARLREISPDSPLPHIRVEDLGGGKLRLEYR